MKTEFVGLFIFLHVAEVCVVVIFGELRIKSVRGLLFCDVLDAVTVLVLPTRKTLIFQEKLLIVCS